MMIEDSKPIMFLFFSWMLDVFLTIINVLSGWGVEINPIINWISPDWVMCAIMIVGSTICCLILIPLYNKYHRLYPIKTMMYSWGSIHLAGAFSGLVVLAGVVMI